MATLTLTGQAAESTDIAPKMLKLKNRLDERAAIWARLPDSKKKQWVTSGIDPIMTQVWQTVQYLEANFPEMLLHAQK